MGTNEARCAGYDLNGSPVTVELTMRLGDSALVRYRVIQEDGQESVSGSLFSAAYGDFTVSQLQSMILEGHQEWKVESLLGERNAP